MTDREKLPPIYHGNCPVCQEKIVPGEDVTYVERELIHWKCLW